MVEQGDILSVRGINVLLLVISKNIYNVSGRAIVCPIFSYDGEATLSVEIHTEQTSGFVCCDSPRQIDFEKRGFHQKGRVALKDIIKILDLFQSLFDYA